MFSPLDRPEGDTGDTRLGRESVLGQAANADLRAAFPPLLIGCPG
jgi:hypothetical protein